jgi:hypothetical protein
MNHIRLSQINNLNERVIQIITDETEDTSEAILWIKQAIEIGKEDEIDQNF